MTTAAKLTSKELANRVAELEAENQRLKRETNVRGPKITDWKGSPMLVLNPESRYPFQFQAGKAHLIVKHFDAIKSFAQANPVVETAPLTADQRELLRKWRNVAKSKVMPMIDVKTQAIKAGLPDTVVMSMLDEVYKV